MVVSLVTQGEGLAGRNMGFRLKEVKGVEQTMGDSPKIWGSGDAGVEGMG